MKNHFEAPELMLHRFAVVDSLLDVSHLTGEESGDGGSVDFGELFPAITPIT